MNAPDHRPEVALLRLSTAGSVDDGKSTLIGRLLYDTKSLHDDQLAALQQATVQRGEEHLSLSLLTDGLRAEREQGITIDVAYRYFATPKRRFIIADTPGHVQYTRNMVTGASNANLALILVDARLGVSEQTKRHTLIASLLRIPHLLLCINKMDLVGWSEARFDEIVREFTEFASRFEVADVQFIPVSALHGDNVVEPSGNLPWHRGGTLLHALETVYLGGDQNHVDARFPVQGVIRPNNDAQHDFRGLSGRVAGGVFKPGDTVVALPSGFQSRIRSIHGPAGEVAEAFAPMSVVMTLEDHLDVSRGDMLAKPNNQPRVTQDLDAMVCWFAEKPLQLNTRYVLRHTTREVRALAREVRYKIDVQTLHRCDGDVRIGMNDIGRITFRTSSPLLVDSYRQNRGTGSFILIDEATNATVGAGVLH